MKNYYREWGKSAEEIKKYLSSENQVVKIGYERGVIKIRNKSLEVPRNTEFKHFSKTLHKFREILFDFISKWEKLIDGLEPIENYKDFLEEDKEEDKLEKIKNLIEDKKETLSLAKRILEWLDRFLEGGLSKENIELPLEKIKEFVDRLKGSSPREPITIEIKV